MSLSPPPPFPDFDFNFDPALLATHPLPLPSSADLFSVDETTDLLGFLDNFGDFGWEPQPTFVPSSAPYSNPHLNTAPEPSTSGRPKRLNTRSSSAREKQQRRRPSPRRDSATPSNASESSSSHTNEQTSQSSTTATSISTSTSTSTSATPVVSASAAASASARTKPLLSTPQKRLNHIMSEQKRRNTIRDGYAQLIALLAPAGAAPGAVIGMMPQRGRPKGSGTRGGKSAGQNTAKGKSGVLFRAVEYIKWLEEGREALRDEVLRVEAAAGIRL